MIKGIAVCHNVNKRNQNSAHRLSITPIMKKAPDSILVDIFSYLTARELVKSVSPVCRRWRRLCYDTSLWREITTHDFASSINVRDETIVTLVRHGKSIKKLSLRGCYQISNRVLKEVAINGTRLQYLNLENCFKITDRGLISIARSCNQLRTVNLLNTRATEQGLRNLIRNNPNLVELTSAPGAVTEATLQDLATHCRQLEFLHVDQNEYTVFYNTTKSQPNNNKKLASLTNNMMEIISNLQQLQVVILRYPVTSINDNSLAMIGHQCKNLECVEIGQKTYTTPLTDHGVIGLCARATNLLRLDLTHTFITDHTLQAIAECCKSLEHLEFGNTSAISDLGVLCIINNCHNLDSFCLSSGIHSRITDMSVFAIAQAPCSQNLIKMSMKNWDITDFGLCIIAKNLPNLLYLSVEECKHLTNEGLQYALKYFESIQSLNLTGTKCITNDKELGNLSRLVPQNFQSIVLKTQTLSVSPAEQGGLITEDGCRKFNEILPDCEIIFV